MIRIPLKCPECGGKLALYTDAMLPPEAERLRCESCRMIFSVYVTMGPAGGGGGGGGGFGLLPVSDGEPIEEVP